MADNSSDGDKSRVSIIQSVQTPLGFFTLVVLITEAILGILASKASGQDFTILVISMCVFMFLLVSVVAYISFTKPELLTTKANQKDEIFLSPLPPDAPIQIREQFSKLKNENEELRTEIARLSSLEARVWTALNQSNSVTPEHILSFLDAEKDPKLKEEIFSIMGNLLKEGKIKQTGNGWFTARK